jgi:hypothetical protein
MSTKYRMGPTSASRQPHKTLASFRNTLPPTKTDVAITVPKVLEASSPLAVDKELGSLKRDLDTGDSCIHLPDDASGPLPITFLGSNAIFKGIGAHTLILKTQPGKNVTISNQTNALLVIFSAGCRGKLVLAPDSMGDILTKDGMSAFRFTSGDGMVLGF